MINQKPSLFEYPIDNKPVTVGWRFRSMLMDHLILCLMMIPIVIPSIIAGSSRPPYKPGFTPLQYYSLIASYAVYFCKDCIGGRSMAKRILGLQVVDNKSGKVASPLQCLTRNMLIIIWPVEVLIIFFSPGRRLGDRLAGTKILNFDSTKKEQRVNISQVVLSFILAYAISLVLTWALGKM